MGPNWDESSPQLHHNLERAAEAARDHVVSRALPDLSLARDWHRQIMHGLTYPASIEPGVFRGETGQTDAVVHVGGLPGADPDAVSGELARFETKLVQAVERLDAQIPAGESPTEETLDSVIDLCAWVHAEWVRIHPFPNGNGRTARLWANWVAMRYGLPPFVRLRPRPTGSAYAMAGMLAMTGDWRPTAAVFRRLLLQCLGEQTH